MARLEQEVKGDFSQKTYRDLLSIKHVVWALYENHISQAAKDNQQVIIHQAQAPAAEAPSPSKVNNQQVSPGIPLTEEEKNQLTEMLVRLKKSAGRNSNLRVGNYGPTSDDAIDGDEIRKIRLEKQERISRLRNAEKEMFTAKNNLQALKENLQNINSEALDLKKNLLKKIQDLKEIALNLQANPYRILVNMWNKAKKYALYSAIVCGLTYLIIQHWDKLLPLVTNLISRVFKLSWDKVPHILQNQTVLETAKPLLETAKPLLEATKPLLEPAKVFEVQKTNDLAAKLISGSLTAIRILIKIIFKR